MVVYSLRLRRKKGLLLTDVLMEEIFVRLPFKSLLSCKFVCKSWYALISNPDFINLFMKMNHRSHNNKIVITKDHHQLFKCDFEFDSLSKLEQCHVPFKGKREAERAIKVAGCSNGLLCFLKIVHQVVFFNPSTRTCKMIAVPYPAMMRPIIDRDYDEGHRSKSINYLGFGFGYDTSSDDFKFVRFFNCQLGFLNCKVSDTMVYSLKTNSWTQVADQHYYQAIDVVQNSDCVCINGALHWLLAHVPIYNITYDMILRFCLHTHKYSRINLPPVMRPIDASLITDLGGQLCISVLNINLWPKTVDVLIYSEQHENGQWTKLFSFNWPDNHWVRPIVYSSNQDKVLVQLDAIYLVWYDLKTKVVCPLSVQGMKQNTPPRNPIDRDYFAYLMYVCDLNPLSLNGGAYQRKKRKVLQSLCH